jgi:carboxypeptidase D
MVAAFQVKSLPDIPYDLGEIYSGLVPIDLHDASRALFFVFQPTISAPTDEIVIWLNGGPGGSTIKQLYTSLTYSRMQLARRIPAREWQVYLGPWPVLGYHQPLLLGQPH